MKDELYKEVELSSDYKVEIYYDMDAESPNTWGDEDCFLVYDHRQFDVRRQRFHPEDIALYLEYKNATAQQKKDESYQESYYKEEYKEYHIFPVYAYIHSGVALSLGRDSYPFTDRWDVSVSGFALVKKTKGWSWTKEKAYKIAESLVETWNEYLSGEVYGFKLVKKKPFTKIYWDGETEEGEDWEEIDSCWSYYGDSGIEQILEECKHYVE